MNRGELWIGAGSGYASKPRPFLIVQTDLVPTTDSVTVCLVTSDPTEAPLLRILVEPTEQNGLRGPCRLMIDKLTTIRRAQLSKRIGVLEEDTMVTVERCLLVFLGLA